MIAFVAFFVACLLGFAIATVFATREHVELQAQLAKARASRNEWIDRFGEISGRLRDAETKCAEALEGEAGWKALHAEAVQSWAHTIDQSCYRRDVARLAMSEGDKACTAYREAIAMQHAALGKSEDKIRALTQQKQYLAHELENALAAECATSNERNALRHKIMLAKQAYDCGIAEGMLVAARYVEQKSGRGKSLKNVATWLRKRVEKLPVATPP